MKKAWFTKSLLILAVLGILFVLAIEKDKKSLIPFLIPAGLLLVISLWGSLNAFSKLSSVNL